MTTQTVKAKIKNISSVSVLRAHNLGDHSSFAVVCEKSDAFRVAYAIRCAGWKRTSNIENTEGKNVITFSI